MIAPLRGHGGREAGEKLAALLPAVRAGAGAVNLVAGGRAVERAGRDQHRQAAQPEAGALLDVVRAVRVGAELPGLDGLRGRLISRDALLGVPVHHRVLDCDKRGIGVEARKEKSQAIALGVSTGGPNALNKVIPQLPAGLQVPVFVVQHMPKTFTASLAQVLNKQSALEVKEAQNGEVVRPNVVYIAPGGMQMKVASGASGQRIIRVNDDPPENNCKPAVDYLFRSVAREYGSKATAVIMTGMGSDGKLGVKVMKSAGAVCIAQNAATCVVYGMPKAVIDSGLADVVAPVEAIAQEIQKTV